ncbi:antitoxin Xre/MbcA/ParS toxin-binding domain-containing protein [Vreelandella massiliensis]|uniref:antitoxin Xre/MbcA/ParS toxin-binding domain-containing protein n=1 Tax=Vreelandella massiliensis TaxID=1816686 RepID=UPI00096A95CA|nr:antitoxin Xre/MbcA/ParS toxin-binding domain-containing protein [Halomonas massiliensis]
MLIRELAKAHDKSEDRIFDRAQMYMLAEGVDVSREVNNEATAQCSVMRRNACKAMERIFPRWVAMKPWRDMPDVGREVLDPPSPEDVRAAAVNMLGEAHAQRWMVNPHAQLENQRPIAVLETNPQRVYALLPLGKVGGNE